jgi:hypothetical protein
MGTRSVDWAQLSRCLPEDDRIQSAKRCVLNRKQDDGYRPKTQYLFGHNNEIIEQACLIGLSSALIAGSVWYGTAVTTGVEEMLLIT